MRVGDKRFWKISRFLRCKEKKKIPYLLNNNSKVITDADKVSLLADIFYKSHELTIGYHYSIANNLKSEAPNNVNIVYTTTEEISNQAVLLSVHLFNICIRLNYFPSPITQRVINQ